MSIRFFSLLLLVSFTTSSVLSCDNDEGCLRNDHHKANLSMTEVESSEGNQTMKLHVNQTDLQQSSLYRDNSGLDRGIIAMIVFFTIVFTIFSTCCVCCCCQMISTKRKPGYVVPDRDYRATGALTQQPVINQYQGQAISASHFPPDLAQQLSSAYTLESSHQSPTKVTQEFADEFPPQYDQLPVDEFPPHPAQQPLEQFPRHPDQHPSQFSPSHPQLQYSATGLQYHNQEDQPPTYDDSLAHLKY